MKLTPDEQAWLEAYCRALTEKYPDLVEEVIIFGSKARGDTGPDSDLDLLLIIREGDRSRKKEVRHVGHQLAVSSDAVPSIMVYTKEEWSRRQNVDSPFYQAVMRDKVRVA